MFQSGATLKHFARLSPPRRRAVREAVVTLMAVSLALQLLPFRRAIRFGSVGLGERRQEVSVVDIVWAVEAAARRLPWRVVCLHKGLAAQRLLRSAGIDALLNYGIRNEKPADKLEAHVWVTVRGQAVIGGDEATGFARVATYPPNELITG